MRVNGLAGAARLAMDQAAYDEAAERCAQAVALARELGDPRVLAAALNTRGLLARAQDRYADSARDHQAALEQARAAADRAGEAVALLGLAYAAMFTGDGPRAGALAEESLAAARGSGDRHTLAQVLFLLGWAAGNARGVRAGGGVRHRGAGPVPRAGRHRWAGRCAVHAGNLR